MEIPWLAETSDQTKIIIETEADLKPLMPTFLSNRQQDIKQILVALPNEDFETIQRLGHSMRGIGGAYGFDFITEAGAGIEKAAQDKQPQLINDYIKALTHYLSRVEVHYV